MSRRMVQHALPLGATKAPAPQVLGACGHCGRPATERTLVADVVCCAGCWAATLRGDRIERSGNGVIYIPRKEGEV